MERPKVTPEMIVQAAQKLGDENGWDADDVADVAKTWRAYMNGYDLAKALDTYCGWDIDVSDVEALDGMGAEVREIHRAACWAWAKDHYVQPPLPIGTMTTLGEITGISEDYAACYKVRANGETNDSRRLIVKFEDARRST